ncbi:MAG: hypothetical protein HY796_03445 [Elusimicrobia bacterium]|nr:hypothetical protein [Elusimicrobiota bacterium]
MTKKTAAKNIPGICFVFALAGYAFAAEDAEIKLSSNPGKLIIQDKDLNTVSSFDSNGNIVTNGTATIAGSGFSVGE